MIADTTFLSDLVRHEHGPAEVFLARHRQQAFLVTVITVGELALIFHIHLFPTRSH